ncbi:MAG: hypothetical protein SFZ23_15575 [Planctomycetota bacterium]|nr:hypothetical protein [Planctomycetota bacterium]
MTNDQLRQVLRELDGERDLEVVFCHVLGPLAPGGSNAHLSLHKAMLIPDEPDHMVKVTDGKSIYILDAERVAYVRIGLRKL